MPTTRVIPEQHEAILTAPSFGHVATIGPHGEPQSSPVWLDYDGEYIRFSQTTTRQKLRNLRARPQVAVSATDPDDPYHYVEVRGVVESIEDDDDYAFINAMAKKYLDRDTYPWLQPGEERVIVVVEPRHFTSQGGE